MSSQIQEKHIRHCMLFAPKIICDDYPYALDENAKDSPSLDQAILISQTPIDQEDQQH